MVQFYVRFNFPECFWGTITLSNEFEIRRIDLKAKNKITSKCMEYYGM